MRDLKVEVTSMQKKAGLQIKRLTEDDKDETDVEWRNVEVEKHVWKKKTMTNVLLTQPRPQAIPRYASERRRTRTERDSARPGTKWQKSPSLARKSPRYSSTKIYVFLRGKENISGSWENCIPFEHFWTILDGGDEL